MGRRGRSRSCSRGRCGRSTTGFGHYYTGRIVAPVHRLDWFLVEVDYADAEFIDVRSAIVAGAGGDRESFAQAAPILANYEMAAREHTRAPDARCDRCDPLRAS